MVARSVGRSLDGCLFVLVARISLFAYEQWRDAVIDAADIYSSARDISLCAVYQADGIVENIALVRRYPRADDIPVAYRPRTRSSSSPTRTTPTTSRPAPDSFTASSSRWPPLAVVWQDGGRGHCDRRTRARAPAPSLNRRPTAGPRRARHGGDAVGERGQRRFVSHRESEDPLTEGPGQRRVGTAVDPGGMEEVVGGDEKVDRWGDGIVPGHVFGHLDASLPCGVGHPDGVTGDRQGPTAAGDPRMDEHRAHEAELDCRIPSTPDRVRKWTV